MFRFNALWCIVTLVLVISVHSERFKLQEQRNAVPNRQIHVFLPTCDVGNLCFLEPNPYFDGGVMTDQFDGKIPYDITITSVFYDIIEITRPCDGWLSSSDPAFDFVVKCSYEGVEDTLVYIEKNLNGKYGTSGGIEFSLKGGCEVSFGIINNCLGTLGGQFYGREVTINYRMDHEYDEYNAYVEKYLEIDVVE